MPLPEKLLPTESNVHDALLFDTAMQIPTSTLAAGSLEGNILGLGLDPQ